MEKKYDIKLRPGATIDNGPADWQIIQRDKQGFGYIDLEGSYSTEDEVYSVQARIVDENTNMHAAYYLDWKDCEVDKEKKRFKIAFDRIPQGGLYRIETRVTRPKSEDSRALRGDCIHHIGVGDVYIIAGQSNASGVGKGVANDGPMLGVHLFANDENWKIATHPIEDATNSLHPYTIRGISHGTTPWLTFGKRIFSKTGIPVGLIPTALCGSYLSQWINDIGEGEFLFNNLADMVSKAGGKVAGLLWYQGESEAENDETTNNYIERFGKFVNLVRELVNDQELPVIYAQLNTVTQYNFDISNWVKMRENQRNIKNLVSNTFMVVTADCSLSDEIHNSSASNVIIGERFANVAFCNIYRLPILSDFPEVQKVSFEGEDKSKIKLEFNNLIGDWTPRASHTDFLVEDEVGIIDIQEMEIESDNSVLLSLARQGGKDVIVHGLYGNHPVITLRDDEGRCITPFSVKILIV